MSEDGLALRRAEHVPGDHRRYTLAEAARRAGVTEQFVVELIRALGVPPVEPHEARFGQDAVEAANAAGLFRQAGLPQEELLELARILSNAMAPVAEVLHQLVAEALVRRDDARQDLDTGYERAAIDLLPLLRPLPEYALSEQLRDLVRREAGGAAKRHSGGVTRAAPMAVAFADLVGFTKLGERVPGEELARTASRLSQLAHELAMPPVRLVKTIGDAVMFVSPHASALLAVVLRLDDLVEAERDIPPLRVGVAFGDVTNRWGDWYGGPVNLASRITEHAPPGVILATKEVRELTLGAWVSNHPGSVRPV